MHRCFVWWALLICMTAATGCQSASLERSSAGPVPPPMTNALPPKEPAAAASAVPTTGGGDGPTTHVQPARMLIQKGALVLQVDDVQAASAHITGLMPACGGFVASSSISESPANERTATLELRVPAASFSDTMSHIGQVGAVKQQTVTGEDVTEQYVDLNSRLRNLQQEEERLLALIAHAGNVKDLLEVEKELTRVRGDIEQAQGRIKHIDALVSYATIDVTLSAHPIVNPAAPSSFWEIRETIDYASYAAMCILKMIVQAVIYAVFLFPFALPIWWIARLATRPPRQEK